MAAIIAMLGYFAIFGFNTQPRGDGCISLKMYAARLLTVSTHSRAEMAACNVP